MARVPGLDRKLRVRVDWTTSQAFRRDVVSLGSIRHPMRAFRRAARQP